jgi:beta-phosphoglucomutase-like phosphatase (HAD superfamily)
VFKATLFDYNGVLIDDEHVHLEAFREVLQPLGIQVGEREYFARYIGYDDVGMFRAILQDTGRAPDQLLIRKLVESKRPVYKRLAEQGLRSFSGAADLVRRRASAGPVGIVSGALRDEIMMGLSVLSVVDCVSAIIAAEDMGAPKPDPAGYLRGIEALAGFAGSEVARRALVIEDSLPGIEAAKRAGLSCVAVAHSYSMDELRQADPDLVVPTLGDLDEQRLGELYRRLHG